MTDNYGIPETLSLEVFSTQLELRGAFRDSLHVGVRLGHLLTEAKAVCRHGEFGHWLAEHFEGKRSVKVNGLWSWLAHIPIPTTFPRCR